MDMNLTNDDAQAIQQAYSIHHVAMSHTASQQTMTSQQTVTQQSPNSQTLPQQSPNHQTQQSPYIFSNPTPRLIRTIGASDEEMSETMSMADFELHPSQRVRPNLSNSNNSIPTI